MGFWDFGGIWVEGVFAGTSVEDVSWVVRNLGWEKFFKLGETIVS